MQIANAVLYRHLWPLRLQHFSTLSPELHDFRGKKYRRRRLDDKELGHLLTRSGITLLEVP
jgi:hypothetical protein